MTTEMPVGDFSQWPQNVDMSRRIAHEALPDAMLLQKTPVPPIRIPLRPKKLEDRMKEHGIEFPRFAPAFDRVFVYPLDKQTQPDATAGGIILAEQVKQKLVAQVGVLIMAGPKAIEELYGHGISLGDVVVTARLSPWERTYFSKENRPHRILLLRAAEIVGSEDLLEAYESGELHMEMDNSGRVSVADRERIDPPHGDEGI
jgi:co-chaperonin GroES (HSP10)